jgi:hypothetical protein
VTPDVRFPREQALARTDLTVSSTRISRSERGEEVRGRRREHRYRSGVDLTFAYRLLFQESQERRMYSWTSSDFVFQPLLLIAPLLR